MPSGGAALSQCTPGQEEQARGRRLPAPPLCLPWGLTFHFPLFRGEAGPTSQTRKVRPQNCEHHLLRNRLPCPCDWRGRVAVESLFTGKKWKPGKKTAGGLSKLATRSCSWAQLFLLESLTCGGGGPQEFWAQPQARASSLPPSFTPGLTGRRAGPLCFPTHPAKPRGMHELNRIKDRV